MGYLDPERQRAYLREWMRARRAEWLADKGCVWCGATANLQIDHIDRTQKVSHRVWSWSRPKRDAELAKCQVLCKPCHLRKTADERRTPLVHGTNSGYSHKGCRCEDCRRAHALACRINRARPGAVRRVS